jgi:hypothetical protein
VFEEFVAAITLPSGLNAPPTVVDPPGIVAGFANLVPKPDADHG